MAHESVQIDPQLWDAFSSAATKQGKKPRTLLARLIRDYLQMQEDQMLFAEMRRDLRGREMTDAEAVDFVHHHRQDKYVSRATRRNG